MITAVIVAGLALVVAGIALVVAVKASDEVLKLAGELHRTPAEINVYETRTTPVIAYSAIEGGNRPDSAAAWIERADLMRQRATRRR